MRTSRWPVGYRVPGSGDRLPRRPWILPFRWTYDMWAKDPGDHFTLELWRAGGYVVLYCEEPFRLIRVGVVAWRHLGAPDRDTVREVHAAAVVMERIEARDEG